VLKASCAQALFAAAYLERLSFCLPVMVDLKFEPCHFDLVIVLSPCRRMGSHETAMTSLLGSLVGLVDFFASMNNLATTEDLYSAFFNVDLTCQALKFIFQF